MTTTHKFPSLQFVKEGADHALEGLVQRGHALILFLQGVEVAAADALEQLAKAGHLLWFGRLTPRAGGDLPGAEIY